MRHIKILLLSLASSFAALAADVEVSTGKLEGILSGGDLKNESTLKLIGSLDARDLAALEKLPANIKTLDLSETSIAALTMPNRQLFGRTLFAEGEIPAYTFFKCGLESLILPPQVTAICEGAFAGSSIKNIIIPEGVTSLGDYAFYGCRDLESVSLPSTLAKIGKGTFGNCLDLTSLDLSATKITEIPEKAFSGSLQLSELSLPAGIKKVGREAFSHTGITSLNLSEVNEFEAYALSGMPFLESLSINPEAIIGDGLLMDNISLATLTQVPDYVPDYFAANCSNLETDYAKATYTLGKYSFANTRAPETLVLTGSISRIDRGAFSGLSTLKAIDASALSDNIPAADELSFEGLSQPDVILWVEEGTESIWQADPAWGAFNIKSNGELAINEIIDADHDSIKISVRNGLLVVEAATAVNDVRIFTPDGRIAYMGSPGRERVEISLSELPSGMLIVAASDDDGNSKTLSILR